MDIRRTYVSFEGRLARLPYLAALMLLTLVSVTLTTTGVHLFHNYPGAAALVVAMAMAAITGANVWATLALHAKRLHDMGYSGWHALWILAAPLAAPVALAMAPPVGMTLLAVTAVAGFGLVLVPGEPAANRYGASSAQRPATGMAPQAA